MVPCLVPYLNCSVPSNTGSPWIILGLPLASYPGRVGRERRPGIDCLRMRGRFRYISVKL